MVEEETDVCLDTAPTAETDKQPCSTEVGRLRSEAKGQVVIVNVFPVPPTDSDANTGGFFDESEM